jgi:hypothetical protein
VRKGLQAVEEELEKSKGGGFTGRLGYLNLKADESIVVRFLTDFPDVGTVDFYEFIVDNKDKGQNFVVSSDYYEDDSVKDWVLELGGKQQDYQTKELIDPQPKARGVGIAVVQKEVVSEGPNGRPKMSYEDDWDRDIEIKGKDGKVKKYEGRKFIVIKQAHKNFWAPLKAIYKEEGTICDRPYKIVRVGGNTDTTYSFMGKQPDPEWDNETSYEALHKAYGYGLTAKERESIPDEERFAYCPQTLDEWCIDSCSESRVKFFLGSLSDREAKFKSDPVKDAPDFAKGEDDEAQAAPPPSSNGKDKSDLPLSERLARHK